MGLRLLAEPVVQWNIGQRFARAENSEHGSADYQTILPGKITEAEQRREQVKRSGQGRTADGRKTLWP